MGLGEHVCEFTTLSLVAWVLGPAPGPHREQGAPGGLWRRVREERQYGSGRFGGGRALGRYFFLIARPYVPPSGFNLL